MPAKVGKFEVWGVCAPVSSVGSASRLTLMDDYGLTETSTQGRVLTDDNKYMCAVIDIKGEPETDTISQVFPEPIKIRKGISVLNADNLIGGRVMLYIR